MQKKINWKRIFFIGVAVFFCSLIWLIASLPALAGYKIEIGLPNLPAGTEVSDPGAYISYFFIFGLGLVGFLAVAAIVVGGIMYMTGGTVGKVERAKQIIWGAITGVVLLLCSYLLLYTIDPSLVNLSPFQLKPANMPASQGGTQCTAPLVFDPVSGQCITPQASFQCTGAGAIPNVSQGECNNQCPQGVYNYNVAESCCICYTGGGM